MSYSTVSPRKPHTVVVGNGRCKTAIFAGVDINALERRVAAIEKEKKKRIRK